MKSNLEIALVECSYRPIHARDTVIYVKVYGFTIILFDITNRTATSFFEGRKGKSVCWNHKPFEDIFKNLQLDIVESSVQELAECIQYYECYDGPHGHGNFPKNIESYMLADEYAIQFKFL